MSDTALTEQEFERWVRIREAVETVASVHPHAWQDILAARIRSGSLRLAARESIQVDAKGKTESVAFVRVVAAPWIAGVGGRFWEVGDHTLRVRVKSPDYGLTMVGLELHGMRIDPDDVAALRRDLGIAGGVADSAPRGRPRWPHWDEFWAQTAAQFARGEFVAASQADIERRMAAIADRFLDPPNESTLRIRASLLWKALKSEAEK